jgi:integrase
MVLEGVDLKTAQTRLGHSDPRLTLAVYAQATNEGDRRAADLLGAAFSRRPRPARRPGRGLGQSRRGGRGL